MSLAVPVLIERFVVEATCNKLASCGWRTVAVPTTAAHGIDIVASQGDHVLHVEAKGAGSSRPGSSRYGKSFTASQVDTCVAKASLRALEAVSAGVIGGVAFPDLPGFRTRVARASGALEALGVVIFWVAGDGEVTLENDDLLGFDS